MTISPTRRLSTPSENGKESRPTNDPDVELLLRRPRAVGGQAGVVPGVPRLHARQEEFVGAREVDAGPRFEGPPIPEPGDGGRRRALDVAVQDGLPTRHHLHVRHHVASARVVDRGRRCGEGKGRVTLGNLCLFIYQYFFLFLD